MLWWYTVSLISPYPNATCIWSLATCRLEFLLRLFLKQATRKCKWQITPKNLGIYVFYPCKCTVKSILNNGITMWQKTQKILIFHTGKWCQYLKVTFVFYFLLKKKKILQDISSQWYSFYHPFISLNLKLIFPEFLIVLVRVVSL